jgi:hypothetical protein
MAFDTFGINSWTLKILFSTALKPKNGPLYWGHFRVEAGFQEATLVLTVLVVGVCLMITFLFFA